jgi:hypothetical protein
MDTILNERNYIDCHICLDDAIGNVVCANGNHQLALTVYYRLVADETPGPVDHVKSQPAIEISLIDQKTGYPLGERAGGWTWSTKRSIYNLTAERKPGEAGSRPEELTGYTRMTVYLSHALVHEHEESTLVGVIACCRDAPEKQGRSVQGVRVFRRPAKSYSTRDFTVSAPQTLGNPEDDIYQWSNDADYRNCWRYAHYFIQFTDPKKSVLKVEYNSRSPETATVPYVQRRICLYETSAYIWPFEAPPVGQRNVKFDLTLPDSTQKEVDLSFDQDKGFVITIVTCLNPSLPSSQEPDSLNPSGSITVYDEQGTASYLFLNQIIPPNWAEINAGTFAPLSDYPTQLSPLSQMNVTWSNCKYGSITVDTWIRCNPKVTPVTWSISYANDNSQPTKIYLQGVSSGPAQGCWPCIASFSDGGCFDPSTAKVQKGQVALIVFPYWGSSEGAGLVIKMPNNCTVDFWPIIADDDSLLVTGGSKLAQSDLHSAWYFSPTT